MIDDRTPINNLPLPNIANKQTDDIPRIIAALMAIDAFTKATFGLGSVNNTADIDKPVSTAQAAADTATLNSAKAYADAVVTGLWDDRGAFDASSNTFPTTGGSGTAGAIMKGDIWTLNGVALSGPLLGYALGSTVRALSDAPGQTAANWAIGESGLSYAPEDAANKSTAVATDQASDVKYPSVKAVFDWATGLFQTLANKDATGGYAGLTLFKLNLKNTDGSVTSFLTNAATAARTWTLPNYDGTLAVLSDFMTALTGSLKVPVGTTAERDGTPMFGWLRGNVDLSRLEWWNGNAWSAVGSGATGGGADTVFEENSAVMTTSYTITAGKNALLAGPLTINAGVTLTIPTGSRLVIL